MWNVPANNPGERETRTKCCIVQGCKSTSTRNPHMRFLTVRKNLERGKAWLNACGKDPESVGSSTKLYVCGNHFNFEEDTTNYMQFKYYSGQRIFLKPDVIPHIFPDPKESSSEGKSLNDDFFQGNSDDDVIQRTRASPQINDSSETESARSCEDEDLICDVIKTSTDSARTVAAQALCALAEAEPPSSLNKSTQISVSVREKYVMARPYYRSKYTQCTPETQDAATSITDLDTVVSSGRKVTFSLPESSSPSNKSQSAKSGTPPSDICNTPSQLAISSGSSGQYKGTPTSEKISEENEDTEDLGYRLERCAAIRKIQNGLVLDDPMFNLGLPMSHGSLLTTLGSYLKTDPLHIMICLKKID